MTRRVTDSDGIDAEPDRWSRWLLERRDGGDGAQREHVLQRLARIRARVLDGAGSLDGATVLDVGAGDGLIGLAALERVGRTGRVIFSDVSGALLARCRERARALGLADRAEFVATRAEDLAQIPDAAVDVVTTRSVLIYVGDKAGAFAAFARVLRPGGRISLFEPINRLMHPEPAGRFCGYAIGSVTDLGERVKAQFAGEAADRAAMLGFDDQDLLEFALQAGFARVHVERHITVEPGSSLRPVSFDALLDIAPNPNAPTIREAIAGALSPEEQERFVEALQAAFAADDALSRMAVAYVTASLAGGRRAAP